MPRSLLTQLRMPRLCRPAAQGFALPIAMGASLLVLLSSSSLQLLALRNKVLVRQLHQRQQIEDTLASAAQQQVAALQAAHGCLLGVDLDQWQQAAADCQLSPAQQQQQRGGEARGHAYRVAAYRLVSRGAGTSTAELDLQLRGTRPWRARYRLRLESRAEGLQVVAVQELGLRGVGA